MRKVIHNDIGHILLNDSLVLNNKNKTKIPDSKLNMKSGYSYFRLDTYLLTITLFGKYPTP
jgi:hypothetical protein